MRIEVKIPKEDNTIDIYVFSTFELDAVFVGLNNQYKPEGMRVWKVKTMWDRYKQRECIVPEPELTDEIRKLAFEEMVKSIKVKTWKEFKPNN